MVLNFAISYLNARNVGQIWPEVKSLGFLYKLIAFSGAVMSACGFTWVYLVILGFLGLASGKLDASTAEMFFNLGYLVLVVPCIGSGVVIWAYSVAVAIKTRKMRDAGIAGWNTFANAYNVYNAVKTVPSAFSSVVEGFKGDKNAAKIAIMLVILAVVGGIITTYYVMMTEAKKHAIAMKAMAPKAYDAY